jgi:hypothetical protein
LLPPKACVMAGRDSAPQVHEASPRISSIARRCPFPRRCHLLDLDSMVLPDIPIAGRTLQG